MPYIRPEGFAVNDHAHIFEKADYRNLLYMPEPAIELCFLSGGSLTVSCGNVRCHAEKGDFLCLIYPAHFTIEAAEPHEHHSVRFFLPYTAADTEEALFPPSPINVTPRDRPVLYLPLYIPDTEGLDECRYLLDEIIRCAALNTRRDMILCGLFFELLGRLDILCRSTIPLKASPAQLHLIHAKRYIARYLHEPIREAALAEHLGLTPEYLCALFREYEGTTVMTYINRMKLGHLVSEMEQNGLTLRAAAEAYGYADPNYVSRLYRKLFGVSITEARTQRYIPWKT